MTATYDPLVRSEVPDDVDLPDLEMLEVWPDQIRVGDYIAGYECVQLTRAEHYRVPAVRIALETDPAVMDLRTEVGRLVLITDRTKAHKLVVQRPIPAEED